MNYKLWLYLFGFLLLASKVTFAQEGEGEGEGGEGEGSEGEGEGGEGSEGEGGSEGGDIDYDVESNNAVDFLYLPDGSNHPFPYRVGTCSPYDFSDYATGTMLYAKYMCVGGADDKYNLTKTVYSDSSCTTMVNGTGETWYASAIVSKGEVRSFACHLDYDYYVTMSVYVGESACTSDSTFEIDAVPGSCFFDKNGTQSYMITCATQGAGITLTGYQNPSCEGDEEEIDMDFSACNTGFLSDGDISGDANSVGLVSGDGYECYYVGTPAPERDDDDSSSVVSTLLAFVTAALFALNY